MKFENIIPYIIKLFIAITDILGLPFVLISGVVLLAYRRIGSARLKLSTRVLKIIGIFPIRDHYYEPLFNEKHLVKDVSAPRNLPGIDFNEQMQLQLLKKLEYQMEFTCFVEAEQANRAEPAFKISNGSFEAGDAEFLFNFLRHTRPKRVVEIGCGASTMIIQHAISLNEKDSTFSARHICIEPYEQPWLDKYPRIKLIREKVESLDLQIFGELEDGDLLFIDSSHMIRPQGDVLHEYLTMVPSLRKGVYVHVHDIFTPRDYPAVWLKDDVLFWNEQYVLEALLTGNEKVEVVAALNFLKHKYYSELHRVCTYLKPYREPGSFYFRVK